MRTFENSEMNAMYEEPRLTITKFDKADVVVTSGDAKTVATGLLTSDTDEAKAFRNSKTVLNEASVIVF